MKKMIAKIITLIMSFFLGIAVMSYIFNKGNLDMTAHMSGATLPVLYFEEAGEYVNPSYGYTGQTDASCLRNAILPLYGDRVVRIALEKYDADIKAVTYEVRSTDMDRLIQNGEIEASQTSGAYWNGELKIKDLLEDGEEYALVLHVETEEYSDVRYFVRIRNSAEDLIEECQKFAEDFHSATLDKENEYPITQYLEYDSSVSSHSLEHVTIHSHYKNVIWGDFPVKETKTPVVTYLELENDALALKLDYEVAYEGDAGMENYQVSDYFRVRRTDTRMYLLDYDRTAERIFSADSPVFSEQSLMLGIQGKEIPYMTNEEGSVVNFVVSGELWSYDIAQNKLAKVFSFKDGNDKRGLHEEFSIDLINMEDSGSMDFTVTGYMNRGLHEGRTGMLLMRYDSLTKTTEELLFVESSKCYGVLEDIVGELLYVSHDDKLYLSYGTKIFTIDLKTKKAEILTENVSAENGLISLDGDMVAWRYGDDRYQSSAITTMDMKTGVRRTYTAEEGKYIRPLGFIGDDFIYGICAGEDIVHDFAGNRMFPMYRVEIVDSSGRQIRSFDYLDKNKYVISASVEDNRIDLACVSKNSDGSFSEALSEPITSNVEENVSTIRLEKKSDEIRQSEYVLTFETKASGKLKKFVPKQILFEDNRTLSLESEQMQEYYHVYARGKVQGVYTELRTAVQNAYQEMGVVTDQKAGVAFKRGSRSIRAVLPLAEGTEAQNGVSDSLEAALKLLLEEEGKYADIKAELGSGKSAYEILKQNSERQVENLTGCSLTMMFYYINEGQNVLAVTSEHSAELIVGYDAQNIFILEPLSGAVRKEGQNDAAERYARSGNVFFIR